MKPHRSPILVSFLLLILASCAKPEVKAPSLNPPIWVDLTYAFDSTTLYWPNSPSGFHHQTDAEGITPGGFYYSSYSIEAPEHGGTHLDAPVHFAEGKWSVDEIPLSRLTGEAICVDVHEKALHNRDYLISIEDMEAWEKLNGKLADSTIVLFMTGYGKFYPDRKSYFGTDLKGVEAIPHLHFPGISPECAEWLVMQRKVKAVGLDTPSLDFGQSTDFKTHQILMGNNCPGFENVANLDRLPAKGFSVVALPMKIAKGSGGPLRIIASVSLSEK